MSTILFNLYGEYLMIDVLAEDRNFKIEGRIINNVRFGYYTWVGFLIVATIL